MAKTMLHVIVGVFAFGFFSLSASGQPQTRNVSLQVPAEPITITMTADHWQTKDKPV
jgi:hypothetical protein